MIPIILRSVRGVINRLVPSSYAYLPISSSETTSHSSSDDVSTPSNSTGSPPSSPSLLSRLLAFLFFLLPSFVQRRLRPHAFKPQRLYATSWLDGLRGMAAFVVFICHYTEGNVGWYIQSYGIREDNDPAPSSPLQLPFLRVIYSGRPMVHIFFVISGFVLSHKSLKLLRAGKYEQLHAALSSSVFRRGFRLFLPTTASTFIIMLLVWTGWMGRREETFWRQLVDWYNAVWRITFSWNWDITQLLPYDPHLWTIPIEMSNSMLLFVTILGVSRMKVYLRLLSVSAIAIYCLKCQHWASFEFLVGMVLAEVGLIQDAHRARAAAQKEAALSSGGAEALESGEMATEKAALIGEGGTSGRRRRTAVIVFKTFLVINLIFAMFTAGWPNVHADKTPGIAFLWRNTMNPFFQTGGDLVSFPWYALGAVQVVLALQQIQCLQNLFVTPFAQYMGNISYAIYVCHGPVLDVFAHRWMPYIWAIVGGRDDARMWGRLFAWFFGLLAMSVPTFIASDIFWRTIDVKSVEFAKWLEEKCIKTL